MPLRTYQGVNTPDSVLEISCLTPKDRADLEFMLKMGVDWVALSFVQRPSDIVEIKRLIMDHMPHATIRPNVMAKIEKPSCFEGDSLQQIVELCDGIMVARGDLGVECLPEDVPILQKMIIDECREQGKPVVVATQMLESMIDSPTPTRAEASDVATAIYDGADAIMLSAESAAGAVRGTFDLFTIARNRANNCILHLAIPHCIIFNPLFSSNSTPRSPCSCNNELSIVWNLILITRSTCKLSTQKVTEVLLPPLSWPPDKSRAQSMLSVSLPLLWVDPLPSEHQRRDPMFQSWLFVP